MVSFCFSASFAAAWVRDGWQILLRGMLNLAVSDNPKKLDSNSK
jgi:hypothetical protein